MPQDQGPRERYSSWVGLIYVFNLIVGTGALTLPAVFAGAGWLFSMVFLILFAFFGFVTVTFIIESIACANAAIYWNRIQSHRVDGESEVFEDTSTDDNVNENTAMINQTPSRYYSLREKVELGEMTGLFFNKVGRALFFICLCVYLYGDLAIYITAISKTMCDIVCNTTRSGEQDNYDVPCWNQTSLDKMTVYRIFVILFVILIMTSSMRWIAFTIMITIAVTEMIQNNPKGSPPLVEFSRTPALIGASIYSFMSHHSLPGIISPFSRKRFILRQLALDYFLICTFYILLSMTGCFAFSYIFDLYTLNFVPSNLNVDGLFMKGIEYYLGLFPVFTLSTSFPIIAITLQNNLKTLFLDVNALERHHFIVKRLIFPTLAIVPPIIVGLLTHNVGILVSFTGSFGGVCIQYIIPVALVWSARKYCAANMQPTAVNYFRSPFKHFTWMIVVLLWSIFCVVLVTINLQK